METNGRILKIKYGVNPNSSGIGSTPFTEEIGTLLISFPVILFGFAMGFSLVSSMLFTHFGAQKKEECKDSSASAESLPQV